MMFEDQMYLFRFNRQNNPIPLSDHAYTVRRRLLRMFVNFGRFGNPTPVRDALLQNIQWPQVTDDLEFLDIDHDLTVGNNPFKERMDLWRDFDRRFNKF
jgi:Carboxylesterase family